mmetsp:Transcript_2001/g.3040  ORF Transcript_2001/g.3040 Transcript_2001/m.3040 type:complete len:253 (+) Transcript_2001:132-890(+)
MPSISKAILSLSLAALVVVPTMSLSPSTAIAVKDYTGVAAGLFNNMRTPAALIAGAIVPVGLLTAPELVKGEPKRLELYKKANCLLAVASLLSEILAITYSTVAINKLAEVQFAPTAGVAQLISKHFELAWIGTNVHFLLGMFGFGLLVGNKAYFTYGGKVARIAGCWSVAAFLQCTSIVNQGMAMGSGNVDEKSFMFAKNLLFLLFKYVKVAFIKARSRPLSMTAFAITAYSLFLTAQQLSNFCKEGIEEK